MLSCKTSLRPHDHRSCKTKYGHRKISTSRRGKCSTVLSKGTTCHLQYSRLSHHAGDMVQYKPGTAIGSTRGRGWARNQREMLRTLPPALVNLYLLSTHSKLMWDGASHVTAVSSRVPLSWRLTFPEPSELKALDRCDIGSDGTLLHHVVQHAADLFVVVVVVRTHVQLHKYVHAILPHHLPTKSKKTPGEATSCVECTADC